MRGSRREQLIQSRRSEDLDRYDLKLLSFPTSYPGGGKLLSQAPACDQPGQDFVVCYWLRIFARAIQDPEMPQGKKATWGWTVHRTPDQGGWLCMYPTHDPKATDSCQKGSIGISKALSLIVTRIEDYPDPKGKPFIVLLGLAIATYAAVGGTLFYRFSVVVSSTRSAAPSRTHQGRTAQNSV